MKKTLFTLFGVFAMFMAMAQTIVSTSPENKNVVLEEFTGIHCVYCPQGHAIAQSIQDANPDDVFLINIHTGGYATPSGDEPDFRTDYGDVIASQSGLTGYPSGTVNRHVFSGGATAMGRGDWTSASNQILGESSYLNVGVEAELNVQTRELTVHVEVYYTGDSPEATNKLNVALLQDNTLGPQTGGDMGDEYVHMHRLVDMVTGQWGVDITSTTTGSFIDETFTYTVPDYYNNVEAVVADMKVVAFVAETTQEIISGNGCIPQFTGIDTDNDAHVKEVFVEGAVCGNFAAPTVKVENLGQNDLTSLTFEYSINGGETATYEWTGTIQSLQTEEIMLDEVEFIPMGDNVVTVTVNDDDNNANNTNTGTLEEAMFAANDVYLELHTDAYGSECSWNLTDAGGTILYSGSGYPDDSPQTIEETFELTPGACYTFNLMDSYGDGGGAVYLTDSQDAELYTTYGSYGSGVSISFYVVDANSAPEYVFTIPTTDVAIDADIQLVFDQPVRALDDSPITDPSTFITFTASTKSDVAFTATMSGNNRVITIMPDENLAINTSHQIQIAPGSVETYFDKALGFVVFNFTTGTETGLDFVENNFSIYPNPASDYVNVEIANANNATVQITDITGKVVMEQQVENTSNARINTSELNTGIYIMKINAEGKIFTQKLSIVK